MIFRSLMCLLILVVSCNAANPLENQVNELKQEIESNPNNIKAHFELGQVYSSPLLREYEESLRQFQKVVDLEPSFSDGYYWLGLTYERLHKNVEALSAFEKAIELGMNNAMIYGMAASQFHLMEGHETIDKRFILYGEKAIELGCKEGNKKGCLRRITNYLNMYLSFKVSQEDLKRIEEYISRGFSLIGSGTQSEEYYKFVQLLGDAYASYPNDPKKWEQAKELFQKAQNFFTQEDFPYEYKLIEILKDQLDEKIENQKYLVNGESAGEHQPKTSEK